MIIYVNNYDVGIEALPTPTITLLLLLLLQLQLLLKTTKYYAIKFILLNSSDNCQITLLKVLIICCKPRNYRHNIIMSLPTWNNFNFTIRVNILPNILNTTEDNQLPWLIPLSTENEAYILPLHGGPAAAMW